MAAAKVLLPVTAAIREALSTLGVDTPTSDIILWIGKNKRMKLHPEDKDRIHKERKLIRDRIKQQGLNNINSNPPPPEEVTYVFNPKDSRKEEVSQETEFDTDRTIPELIERYKELQADLDFVKEQIREAFKKQKTLIEEEVLIDL